MYIFKLYAKRSLFSSYIKQPSTPLDDGSSHSPKHFFNEELLAQLLKLSSDFIFFHTHHLTFSTLALILRRTGDKNVLFYIYILLTFLSTTISILYVSVLLYNIAP